MGEVLFEKSPNAFDEDFVTDDMNSLHAEHSFPPVAEVLAQPYRT